MSIKETQLSDSRLYAHPFSKAYWRQAASEFKKTKVLIFAAVMIALRVVLKMVSIPIGPDLRINTAFFINAYGAMVFGPVVAIVSAAISDTLGVLLFPTGAYFFPFIFIEIAGSLVFALFLYRAEVSATRVILSRFCIDFFVNIVLNTPVMMLYYSMVMGKYYAIFDLPRIAKNLCMFPIESFLLIIFLRAVIPQTNKLGYVYSGVEKLRFTRKNALTLAVLFVIGVASVAGYSLYSYNTTSLSAKYTAQERLERNQAMNEIVLAENAQLEGETVVSIVESAIPKFGDPNVTYSVAVYTLDQAKLDARIAEEVEASKEPKEGEEPKELTVEGQQEYWTKTINGYSKSKAKQDDALVSVGMATIVVDKKTDAVVSYEDNFE